jgi:hypothetical protein
MVDRGLQTNGISIEYTLDSNTQNHRQDTTVQVHQGDLLLVAVDCMGIMRNLRSRRPDEACRELIHKFVSFQKSVPHMRVTFVLVSDRSSLVPPRKAQEQKRRSDQPGGVQPYECASPDKAYLSEEGVCLGEGTTPVPLAMDRLFSTRPLRWTFYRYLVDWIARPNNTMVSALRLWVDFDLPLPREEVGDPRRSLQHPGVARLTGHGWESCPSLQTGCGEAEVGSVAWGLRFRLTHHVQLWSGDLDTVAIAFLHAHHFPLSLTTVVCAKYTCVASHPNRSPAVRRDLIFSLFLGGTDYVSKSTCGFRVSGDVLAAAPTVATWCNSEGKSATVVDMGRLCALPPVTALRSPEEFVWFWQLAYTLQYRPRKTRARVLVEEGLFLAREVTSVMSLRRKDRQVRPRSGVGPPTVKRVLAFPSQEDLTQGRDDLWFQWEYWASLQGFLDRRIREEEDPLIVGLCGDPHLGSALVRWFDANSIFPVPSSPTALSLPHRLDRHHVPGATSHRRSNLDTDPARHPATEPEIQSGSMSPPKRKRKSVLHRWIKSHPVTAL